MSVTARKPRAKAPKKPTKNIKLSTLLAKKVVNLDAEDDEDVTFEIADIKPVEKPEPEKQETKAEVKEVDLAAELEAVKKLLYEEVEARKKKEELAAKIKEENRIRKLEEKAIRQAAKQAKELAEQAKREQEAQAHREYLEQLIIKGKASHVAQLTDRFNKQILAARTNNLNF